MPSYSVSKPSASLGPIVIKCSVSSFRTTILSVLSFGEAVDPTVPTVAVSELLSYAEAVTTSVFGEKLNTRTQVASSQLNTSAAAINLTGLFLVTSNGVSFHGWRGDFRRAPLIHAAFDGTLRQTFSTNQNLRTSNSATLEWAEGTLNYARSFRRSRKGVFFYAANDCCLHKVTGGGAFEWTSRPHYLNDGLTWLDERVWELGYSQSEVWSINNFAGAVDINIDGTGLGVVASAVTGQVLFYIDFSSAGGAGSPLLGIGLVDSTVVLAAVAANAVIGVAQIDVTTVLASVAASPGIGAGAVITDMIATAAGVAASPAVGSFVFDASATLGSVAAVPAIGSGSVDTPLAECRAMDFYSETNQDSTGKIGSDASSEMAGGLGQCFTGNGEKIVEVRWYLYRQSVETLGNAVCKIWSLTGSFGTTGNVNTLLATSDLVDVSTIPGAYTITGFAFSGANQYITTNSIHYVATIEYTGSTDTGQFLGVGYDGSSGTHPGNFVYHNQSTGGVWTAGDGSIDVCFYVCGVPIDVTVTAAGVSATPTIGEGAIEIEAISVSHATEPIKIRIPRKVKPPVLVDVEFGIRQGVAADIMTGAGRFDVAAPVSSLPYQQTVFDPLALIDVTCPFGAGPISVVSLGEGIIRITPELYEDEIAALLDSM